MYSAIIQRNIPLKSEMPMLKMNNGGVLVAALHLILRTIVLHGKIQQLVKSLILVTELRIQKVGLEIISVLDLLILVLILVIMYLMKTLMGHLSTMMGHLATVGNVMCYQFFLHQGLHQEYLLIKNGMDN